MKSPSLRGKGPAEVGRALAGNRQFVAGLAVLLIAVLFFPGSPAPSLLLGEPNAPRPVVAEAPAPPPTTQIPSGPQVEAEEAEPSPPGEVGPPRRPGAAPAPPPPLVCDTDALADALDALRQPLGELLGIHVPGSALRDLAAIATGCSDKDPTGPLVDLALEVGGLVPDLGLDPINLPNLRPLFPDLAALIPDVLVDLLAPVSDPIKQACANLPLVTLVLTLTPVIIGVPVSGGDIVQFLDPVFQLCSLFDDELDDSPVDLPGLPS